MPRCTGPNRVIAFIEDMDVIRKILRHLGLWDDRRKPEPRANAPSAGEVQYTIEGATPSADDLVADLVYSVDVQF